MEIKKILVIESPIHLYKMIEKNPSVIDSAQGDLVIQLRYYLDLASEYLYGCKCDEDSNWARLEAEYLSQMREDSVIEHLCRVLECDRIDFK